ncbi:MAG: aspartate aminotransferase family protein [Christensenellales bacterium]
MKTIKELDAQYIANTYARYDLLLKSGKGCTLFDDTGKKYIDLGAGIAVNTFGAVDDAWRDAVIAQLVRLQHTSNLYYTQPQVELAQMLCERTGFSRVFFSNSGAEANECAIKAARKYANDRHHGARDKIITLQGSFHGRTVTTLSATGQAVFHTDFGPFTPGFCHVEPDDLDAALHEMDDACCAVMIELVQGEGGVRQLDYDYVQALAKAAKERDILLIVDEVQTGNGRCGSLYCYMQYDIMPDIISTAKGLAGGLPMGATLLGEKVKDVLSAGTHGSTFGGNPLCAAGALSILSRIDDALLNSVRQKGDYIRAQLTGACGVKSVSGLGLMVGIETEKDVKAVVLAAMQKGVLALTAKNKVRLLPALTITQEELAFAIDILKEVIAS